MPSKKCRKKPLTCPFCLITDFAGSDCGYFCLMYCTIFLFCDKDRTLHNFITMLLLVNLERAMNVGRRSLGLFWLALIHETFFSAITIKSSGP